MPKEAIQLPGAYDAESEKDKFLQRLKKKAAKSFSFTSMKGLFDSHDLAWFLYIYGRVDECLEVCTLMAQVQFTGNFNYWSPVETTLALAARIYRERGEDNKADTAMDLVRAAGFVPSRLSGELLSDREIQECVKDGDKTGERDFRMGQLSELCFIQSLGGSAQYPVEKIEALIQEQWTALRTLLKI